MRLGVAIVMLASIAGYLVGLLVIGGDRNASSALWGVLGLFVALFGGAVVVRALLFRRWNRRG